MARRRDVREVPRRPRFRRPDLVAGARALPPGAHRHVDDGPRSAAADAAERSRSRADPPPRRPHQHSPRLPPHRGAGTRRAAAAAPAAPAAPAPAPDAAPAASAPVTAPSPVIGQAPEARTTSVAPRTAPVPADVPITSPQPIVADAPQEDEVVPLRGLPKTLAANMDAQPHGAHRDERAHHPGQAHDRQPHRDQQPPAPRPRRQGVVHAPHRLGADPGAQGVPEPERLLRRGRRQAEPRRSPPTSASASRSTCPSPTAPARCSCPRIKRAETMTLQRVPQPPTRTSSSAPAQNKLTADDFAGTTISLTNPGGIGTVHSVPRLMKGQGCIIGAGALEYPAEFQGAVGEDPRRTSRIGKTITLTSTYDHRVIQGAGSGEFLKKVHELPHRPARLLRGHLRRAAHPLRAHPLGPRHPGRPRERHRQDGPRAGAHQRVPGARPPDGRHRPARVRAALAPRPRHREPRPHLLGPRPRVRHRRLRRQAHGAAARHPRRAARLVLPHHRHRVHAHPGPGAAQVVPGRASSARTRSPPTTSRCASSASSTRPRRSRPSCRPSTSARSASASRAASPSSPLLDEILQGAAEDGLDEVAIGMAHRGRLNVLTNIAGKTYGQVFREFEGTQEPEELLGLRRREVPPRHRGHLHRRRRPPDPGLPRREPVAPRGRRRRARGHRARQAGPQADRHVPDRCRSSCTATRPWPARASCVETLQMSQLRGYRTGGTIHVVVNNQVGFTTVPGDAPLVDLLDGCRQDDPGADLPRERRRPRGRRARRRARVRVPPGVQARRRHRPGLLPPPRPQRGRRPLDDAAADVQPHRGQALGAQALHRGAGRPRRHHRGGVRGGAPRLPGPPGARLRRDARRADRRDPDHRRRPSATSRPGAAGRSRTTARRPTTGVAAEVVHAIGDAHRQPAGRVHRAPEAPAAAQEARRHEPQRQDRLGLRRAARARLAAARGHPGAPRRPGRPPRHVRAAPRRAPRPR